MAAWLGEGSQCVTLHARRALLTQLPALSASNPACIWTLLQGHNALAANAHDHRAVHAVHVLAGGVLADAGIAGQSPSSLRAVAAPKSTASASHRHQTAAEPVNICLLFGSAAALVGNAGQAGYAAANGTLDALAQRAQREGLRWHSTQWGPWAHGGMADAGTLRRLAGQGMVGIAPAHGLHALARAMAMARPLPPPVVLAMRVLDWARALGPVHGQRPRFAEVAPTNGATIDDLAESIGALIAAQLGRRPLPNQTFAAAGLDADGRRALCSALGAKYSVPLEPQDLVDHPDALRLALLIAERAGETPRSKPAEQLARQSLGSAGTHQPLTRADTLRRVRDTVASVLGSLPGDGAPLREVSRRLGVWDGGCERQC